MASPLQRAQVFVWQAETKSFIAVQRNYLRVYGGDAPDKKNIKVLTDKIWGQRDFTNNMEVRVSVCPRRASNKSPTKSIRQASRELQVPRTTLHRVTRKRLHLFENKVQNVQEVKPDDKTHQRHVDTDMLVPQHLPGSTDWEQRTNMLATAFAGRHSSRCFLWCTSRTECMPTACLIFHRWVHGVIATVTPDMLAKTWREIE